MADTFRGIITADGKKRQLPYRSVLETPIANKTLDIEGAFADAKVVGDKFKKVNAETASLKEDIAVETSRATAVENTKADKTALARTNRSLDALWKLNQGISYEFQTDEAEAYQKTVPSGAKMANVKSIGGKTIVWNQLYPYDLNNSEILAYANSCKLEIANGIATVYFYAEKSGEKPNVNFGAFFLDESIPGHTYLVSEEIQASEEIQVEVFGSDVHLTNNYKKVSIIKKADNITSLNYLNYIIRRGQYNNDFTVKFRKIQIFDLTQMLGSGNEPSTPEEFEAMFPADYYSYNEGELLSMGVNEVVEQGKNLLNYDAWKGLPITRGTAVFEKNSFTLTATENDCYTEPTPGVGFPDDAKIEISEGETVTLSWESSADIDGNIYIFPNGVTDGLVYTNNHSVKALTYTATRGVKFITFRFGVAYAGNTISYKNIQIEKKTKATSYEPYHSTAHTIPQSILQLDGYGDGVTDKVYNYVDWENKKYYKRVGKVDLGTVNNFILGEPLNDGSGHVFYFIGRESGFKNNSKVISNKLIYSIPLSGIWENLKLNEIYITSDPYVVVAHNASTLDEFKQAMSGVILYYELAEEQITDIADLIGDTLQEPIEVEAGGSLTFRNTHGANYRVSVPNSVEYIVKLSEVAK